MLFFCAVINGLSVNWRFHLLAFSSIKHFLNIRYYRYIRVPKLKEHLLPEGIICTSQIKPERSACHTISAAAKSKKGLMKRCFSHLKRLSAIFLVFWLYYLNLRHEITLIKITSCETFIRRDDKRSKIY